MPFLTAQLIIERDGAPLFSDAASCTLAAIDWGGPLVMTAYAD
jgi:hypothetical protein